MDHYESGICYSHDGSTFDVFNPKKEDVKIPHIAHFLSQQCRFGGRTKRFYSVAEHCLLVAELAGNLQLVWPACKDTPLPRLRLLGLLHDAAEAYLVDVPTPIKRKLIFELGDERFSFDAVERGVLDVIYDACGLVPPNEAERELVACADEIALAIEIRHLLPGMAKLPKYVDLLERHKEWVGPPRVLGAARSVTARTVFVQQYNRLRKKLFAS